MRSELNEETANRLVGVVVVLEMMKDRVGSTRELAGQEFFLDVLVGARQELLFLEKALKTKDVSPIFYEIAQVLNVDILILEGFDEMTLNAENLIRNSYLDKAIHCTRNVCENLYLMIGSTGNPSCRI